MVRMDLAPRKDPRVTWTRQPLKQNQKEDNTRSVLGLGGSSPTDVHTINVQVSPHGLGGLCPMTSME